MRKPGFNAPLWCSLILIVGSRLYLESFYAPFIRPEMRHDDALFLDQALNIVSGKWLGPIVDSTLIKAALFPLSLAFASILKVPYLVFQLGFNTICAIPAGL